MKKLLFSLILFLLLTSPARAEDLIDRSFALIDGEAVERAVPGEARDLLEDAGIGRDLDFTGCLQTLLRRGLEEAASALRGVLSGGVRLFAVLALCAAVSAFSGKIQREIRIAGTLALTLSAAGDVQTLLGLGRETVTGLTDFGRVLMPVLTAAAAASGAVTSSTAVYTAVMFVIDLLLSLLSSLMLPLVWACLALSAAGSAAGNEGLHRMAGSLKNGITTALRITLGVFVCYLVTGGLIAGTADAMTVKSVRLAISTAVPGVGNVMADAAEAVVAGAGIVRSVTGGFGMLVILASALCPLLRLAAQYLIFRLAALFAGVVGVSGLERLLEGLGGVFSLLLTMTGASAALLLVGVFAACAGVRI